MNCAVALYERQCGNCKYDCLKNDILHPSKSPIQIEEYLANLTITYLCLNCVTFMQNNIKQMTN